MKMFKTSLLLIMMFSQLSWAKLNEKQREVLPFLKAMNGVKIEKNLIKLSPLIAKHHKLTEKIDNYSFIRDNDCRNYQLSRTRVNLQISDLLERILEVNRSDIEIHTYLKTRLEMYISYKFMLGNFAANGAEGGIKTLSDKKKKCLVNEEDRSAWLEDIAKSDVLIKKINRKIFGIRTFFNLHDDSVFYAQKALDNATYEKNKFFILTGASLLIFPIAAYYVPVALASVYGRVGLGVRAMHRTKMAYNGVTVASMAVTGALSAEVFFEMEKELIFEKQKKVYKAVKQLAKTDLESPQVHLDYVKEIENTLSDLFEELRERFEEQYRNARSRCIDDDIEVNCRKKWHLYL
jgi:hypothetical protein